MGKQNEEMRLPGADWGILVELGQQDTQAIEKADFEVITPGQSAAEATDSSHQPMAVYGGELALALY